MKNKLTTLLFIAGCAALITGCALFGNQAQAPGAFEEKLFTTTNVPMVTVHSFTNFVTVTNVVPVVKEQVVTVNHTNEVGVVVPTFETNHVTVYETNKVQEPRVVEAGTTVLVPQLTGNTAKGDAIQSTARGIAGLFGYGGLVTIALSGLGHWYQAARNKALAASYTGASTGQVAVSQAAGALTQNVETILEVLNGTPEGQKMLPAVYGYLRNHQLEVGVAKTVDELIATNVDNPAAKEAAAAILKVLNLKAA